ncbi:MAG: AAA family ATPase [Gammaproteobacteria bacterium]|jgi:predicted AAA+ superfamily ATPase
MDGADINHNLARGELDFPSMFPHLVSLKESPYVFDVDFGLKELPEQPGILLIRGPRQYGKSTWLEAEIFNTVKKFGPATAYYLNGENILSADLLEEKISELLPVFSKQAPVRRIFIDEITAIPQWEIALKRMVDRGQLSRVLVITTGSKATDLRRGAEKLPGRKGKLARTNYLFTPISYREFHRKCSADLGRNTLMAYLLSGGSPIACSELACKKIIPEYVIELVRDWIDGEMAFSGRSRIALLNIMRVLFRLGGTPIGQAKLAREAGLANNTVAAGYIEMLNDLGCVVPAYPWDQHKKILILRKQCKYHFTNLLSAVAYYPTRIRSVDDFLALPEKVQGMWYEWLVAQELQRRASIRGRSILDPLAFWQNKEKEHEIDFVEDQNIFIEVKRGVCSALEFSWFAYQFPHKILTVINQTKFCTDKVNGIAFEDFLLEL